MPKQSQSRSADLNLNEIDIAPSRKFKGTDDEPIDANTGETLFEDITPRLRTYKAPDEEPEVEDDEADVEDEVPESEDDEPIEDDQDLSDLNEPVEESDEELEEAEKPAPKDKFFKRLQREKRLREETEANYSELQKRIDTLEAKQRVDASEIEYTSTKTKLDGEITKVREKLEAAVEAGDTKAQVALTEELSDLKSDLRVKKDKFETAKEAIAKKAAEPPSSIVTRKVQQWTRAHRRFGTDQVFQDFVKSTDRQIAKEGFDPESSEYYAELDKRVKQRYPEEYPKTKQANGKDKNGTPVKRASHPSASFRRDNGAKPKTKDGFVIRGSKVTLTARQQENMRAFQLDPSNPNDVREYVNNNLSK